MNRKEFINGLREALELKMDKNEIDAQIEYYNNYIKCEIKSGRAELEVVEELGDPWAIAKNLGYDNETIYEEFENQPDATHARANSGFDNKIYTTNSKWVVWGILFLFIAIIFVLFSFTMSLLSFFAPVLVPLFLVMLVFRILKK